MPQGSVVSVGVALVALLVGRWAGRDPWWCDVAAYAKGEELVAPRRLSLAQLHPSSWVGAYCSVYPTST